MQPLYNLIPTYKITHKFKFDFRVTYYFPSSTEWQLRPRRINITIFCNLHNTNKF